ncbi:EamA family transporter [Winogradskyella sp. UBA3174]|uniref:EamA family transporter n=1 Tax=Winogradskyella sp. UBA3174 TaxID=1947785 RepID=UPI0025F7EB59|nr:EamA family transporter [Winogradskyella sp. UBA3174]|tara:strand:+ start:424 stop:1323 length:900 start_codon:yes stop_codon:yes gene_type:complete
MKKPSSKSLIIIAFIAIYVIWGSTYLLNKISVTELPPLFLAAIRFFVASILIFSIAKALKFSLKITKKQLLNSTLVGFLFLVYGNGVFVWALKYVDSGFGALLASTQPLFVLLLMRLMDHKRMRPKSLIGVGLGIIGMYLLVTQKELVTNEETLLGVFMIFTCVFSWSYGSVFVAKADVPKNSFVSTGYQMAIASIMLACASLSFGETWTPPLLWSPKVQLAMLALITFGSIVAFTAFNYLLKQVSTEKVATSAYVNPIVAMALGWYVLDETLSIQSIIAAVVLLTGVYFITTRKKDGV